MVAGDGSLSLAFSASSSSGVFSFTTGTSASILSFATRSITTASFSRSASVSVSAVSLTTTDLPSEYAINEKPLSPLYSIPEFPDPSSNAMGTKPPNRPEDTPVPSPKYPRPPSVGGLADLPIASKALYGGSCGVLVEVPLTYTRNRPVIGSMSE